LTLAQASGSRKKKHKKHKKTALLPARVLHATQRYFRLIHGFGTVLPASFIFGSLTQHFWMRGGVTSTRWEDCAALH
jgi:hypothetical protein